MYDAHIQAWVRDRVKVLAMLEEYHRLVDLREKRECGHYRNPTIAWKVAVREDGVTVYRDVMMEPVEPGVVLA